MAMPETAPKEQTMDEILASIRRIIESHDEPELASTDQHKDVVSSRPKPVDYPVRDSDARDTGGLETGAREAGIDDRDFVAFREALRSPESLSPKGVSTESFLDTVAAEIGVTASKANMPSSQATEGSKDNEAQHVALISEAPARKAAAAFDELAALMARSQAKPLEDTAEDLLRPMLKAWLDEHLPSVVERMVREEIERISRGGI